MPGDVFELGETTVRWEISDEAHNTEICEFRVTVAHPPRPLIVELVVSPNVLVCPGQEVVLTPAITGGTGQFTYIWNHRNWTEAVMKDFPEVNTFYELTVFDGITTAKASANISVLPRPHVNLQVTASSGNDVIAEGEEILITATPGFLNYKFIVNRNVRELTENSITDYAVFGRFDIQVFATDANGCVAGDYRIIDVDGKEFETIITPQIPKYSNVFLEGYLKEGDRLEVYNRQGLLLYEGNEGWNGYYRGTLMPQGTYMYILYRRNNFNELVVERGTVTLFQ